MALIIDSDGRPTGGQQPGNPQGGPQGGPQGAGRPGPGGMLGLDGQRASAAGPSRPAGDLVKDGSTESFMVDVIEASLQVPVIVDFWAPWCGPCKTLGPILEKVVRQAGGMVRLVKIDVDQNQQLAAQLRIQSIPAVYAFKDGKPADGFAGTLPESQVKAFVDRLLGDAKPPLEEAVEQAKAAVVAGDAATAGDIYNQILAHEPGYAPAIAGLIRCAMAGGDAAAARGLVDGLDPATLKDAAVAAAVAALELAEQASGHQGDVAALQARLAANPKDHQARFDLALCWVAAGRTEAAIDELLELIKRDRAWNEEGARKQLIKIFDALGATHPLTLAGRRRLSSILFS